MRRARIRFAFAVVLGVLGVLAGTACLSPTLPLPPPEAPDAIHASSSAQGFWTVTGDCDPGAIVTVFNERTGKGSVIEDREAKGRYTILIEADLCDAAWVKQEFGVEGSARTPFVIEERTMGAPADPAACP